MKRRPEVEPPTDAHDDDRRANTPLMALALFVGVVAGALAVRSWYRDHERRSRDRRDRIERREGEGGALPETIGAGGTAKPRPAD